MVVGIFQFLSAWHLAATAQETEGSSAYDACVPMAVSAVPIENLAPGGLFVAASGQRFFASDLHRPPEALPAGADLGRGNTLAAPLRFEAVPLGPENRWGLIPAWIVVSSGDQPRRLYQEEQLHQGGAMFAPERSEGLCADRLRRAERDARIEGEGLWNGDEEPPVYSTAQPDLLQKRIGRFVIAQGRIVSLGKTERTRYLNFGKYWKTDLTATLKASDEEAFNAVLGRAGWGLEGLTGKTVELRGVVQDHDGPLITLRHPEQLIVLETKRAERAGQDSD